MAGGALRAFGSIFLIGGILALLAGLGVAGYGYFAEEENKDQGYAWDPERSGMHEDLLLYGAIAAGAGLFGILLGSILLGIGGAVEEAALRHEDEMEYLEPVAVSAVDEADTTPTDATPTDERPTDDSPSAGVPSRGVRAGTVAAAVALAGILVAAALLFGDGGQGSMFDDTTRTKDAGIDATRLETETRTGSIKNTVMFAGNSQGTTGSDNRFPYTPPRGSNILVFELTWDTTTGGADTLDLFVRDADGNELGRIQGTSPLRLPIHGAYEERSLEILAYPEGMAGFVAEQPIRLTIDAYA